jgi:hypothetical protein
MNQTAHISLQIPSISKSDRNKTDRSALSYSARPPACLCFFAAAVCAASVRRYLRTVVGVRKGFFLERCVFCAFLGKAGFFQGLAQGTHRFEGATDNKISHRFSGWGEVPQGYPPLLPSRPAGFDGIRARLALLPRVRSSADRDSTFAFRPRLESGLRVAPSLPASAAARR